MGFGEAFHAAFLSQGVEGAVAADGEEPFGEVAVHFGAGRSDEADEGVLHDVPGAVGVAVEEAGGVAEEGELVLRDESAGVGVRIVGVGDGLWLMAGGRWLWVHW